MVLAIHSNINYLSKSNTHRYADGHFFLLSDDPIPPNTNSVILSIAQIVKAGMSSTVEAELMSLYISAHKAVYIRHILIKLGHL